MPQSMRSRSELNFPFERSASSSESTPSWSARSRWIIQLWAAAALLIVLSVAAAMPLWANERMRLWVDANGVHSVQAELLEVLEEEVVLRRSDGKQITLAIDLLSKEDQQYIEKITAVEEDGPEEPVVRATIPEPKNYTPLPEIDLPASGQRVEGIGSLADSSQTDLQLATDPPASLPADPVVAEYSLQSAKIAIPRLSYGESLSRLVPVSMNGSNGAPETAVVCSVSGRSVIPGQPNWARLLRFDVAAERAYIVHEHDDSLRILDHDPESGNLLLHIGFNAMNSGGELAIGTGLENAAFQIEQRRSLSEQGDGDSDQYQPSLTARKRHLRWARWVDSEHVMAVIDNSLGLWNLRSGKQLYAIGSIEESAVPALSAGRHYLAVPCSGSVQLFDTETGKSLGQIESGRQVPGISFSKQGAQLAIVTSRRLLCWDLTEAAIVTDISTRRSLGRHAPVWIDSDLVLTSSGVLVSQTRKLPIWRYEMSSESARCFGPYLAMMRKRPLTALTISAIPHPSAQAAIDHIDSIHVPIDHQQWQIAGRSDWQVDGWVDRDVRISEVRQEESAETR